MDLSIQIKKILLLPKGHLFYYKNVKENKSELKQNSRNQTYFFSLQ